MCIYVFWGLILAKYNEINKRPPVMTLSALGAYSIISDIF